MRISENFVLRQLADTWVVLPLASQTVNFNEMITLNETGVLLWKTLECGADLETLVAALTAEYAVTPQQARQDAAEFVEKIRAIGCVEMD